ncbi:hypothetical protein GCM10023194_35140 [Planotetraspora phitsanulokensis]|uniref:FtsK domain-containing protein n=1 Tax=Planotetraspora phitsanulokensis TaxID=575192 RepID=A0A8J3U0Q9_9ACTN|nr:type VII secretion protein EccCb [Planotetraspora phitsanulokensis]GII36358.1 hypothetical protein Pph01_13610 [Planotetraspora phitsanulokensis]
MGRRIALLIATDGYGDPGLNQLRAPGRDAGQLAVLLEDQSIGRFDHVRVLLNRPKAEIEAAIEELLTNRMPDDLVLLYMACHGLANDMDRLFFATVDTQLVRRNTTAIRASFVHDLLDECEAAAKIVLLDCCYGGLFNRGLSTRSERRVDVEREVVGKGTVVLTSTTSLAYAYEGTQFTDNGEPASVFTSAVIEGLRSGAADANRDGIVTPDELYDYVFRAVVSQLGEEQKPTKKGSCVGRVDLAYAPSIHERSGSWNATRIADGLALGSLLPPLVSTMDQGLRCEAWPGSSRLEVPIGRIDRRTGEEPVVADLASRGGHVAVVGKSGSGKTTLLRTLLMALALTHSPEEAVFFLLEGRVNGLGVLRRLPHVQMVAAPHEADMVTAVLTKAQDIIESRQSIFRRLDIESVDEFRALRVSRKLPPGMHGDVFLVIDGWLDFSLGREVLEQEVQRVANAGLYYGVHVVLSSRQWSNIPAELLSILGTRYELALEDPGDSRYDSVLSSTLATGRGLVGGRPFRVALPRIDADADHIGDREAIVSLSIQVQDAWSSVEAAEPDEPEPLASNVLLTELLGIADAADIDLARMWRPRPLQEQLRVPIGIGYEGEPVMLDLKEAARGGMGPHGLCVGATGSGKSELLRSLVLALAVTHSSENLNFILADFKGGTTFNGMTALPHVAASITNLADELVLVDRMRDAIAGELARRQELLATGNYASVWDYEAARAAGTELAPLPSLLIVIDEFTELLKAKPEFIDTFTQIGRLGRSLGVHLLLASQRLEEGTLRGLDTYLSYRIGLRTSSATESRAVLGVPDAYQLLPLPGSGYLQFSGTGSRERFKGAYASDPYRRPDTDGPVHVPPEDSGEGGPVPGDLTIDVIVRQLAGQGPPAHQVWLPPLGAPITLDALLPGLAIDPERGLMPDPSAGNSSLRVPLGIMDRPFQQRRDVLYADLSGAGGQAVVVGGPLSGKTTLLRTLISSLALTHTPTEVQFFCLDFGGGGLAALSGLPHMSGVGGRLEGERVRRIVLEVANIRAQREEIFLKRGFDSAHTYREQLAAGQVPEDQFGDVFLVIDGWSVLRQDFEELEPHVLAIAHRGAAYGIHLVLSAERWSAVRPALRDTFGTRLELRLGDPGESEVDRRIAASVPEGTPGRGLSPDQFHFLTALPRIDGHASVKDLGTGVRDLVDAVREAWRGPAAPQVRLLPRVLPLADFAALKRPLGHLIPLGVGEGDLAPVVWDFEAEPNMMIFGENESGKSNTLRLIARGIVAGSDFTQARIIIADYRRALLGAVDTEHLIGYAASGPALASTIADLKSALEERLPGPDVTPEQLRNRSWWTGPELYLLVDDYDLVATLGSNPLAPLTELLPMSHDIGLHLVVARRSGGAGRALFEPVLQRLRDLGTGGLLLSGDKAEGHLIGNVRPSRQPSGRGVLVTRQQQRLIQVAHVSE